MPLDIAPHALELRAAEVAGGDGDPLAGGGGGFHADAAKVLDPIPVEHGPVFEIDNAPALGGYERLLVRLERVGCLDDVLAEEVLPVFGFRAIERFAFLNEGLIAIESVAIVFVACGFVELAIVRLRHPEVRLDVVRP